MAENDFFIRFDSDASELAGKLKRDLAPARAEIESFNALLASVGTTTPEGLAEVMRTRTTAGGTKVQPGTQPSSSAAGDSPALRRMTDFVGRLGQYDNELNDVIAKMGVAAGAMETIARTMQSRSARQNMSESAQAREQTSPTPRSLGGQFVTRTEAAAAPERLWVPPSAQQQPSIVTAPTPSPVPSLRDVPVALVEEASLARVEAAIERNVEATRAVEAAVNRLGGRPPAVGTEPTAPSRPPASPAAPTHEAPAAAAAAASQEATATAQREFLVNGLAALEASRDAQRAAGRTGPEMEALEEVIAKTRANVEAYASTVHQATQAEQVVIQAAEQISEREAQIRRDLALPANAEEFRTNVRNREEGFQNVDLRRIAQTYGEQGFPTPVTAHMRNEDIVEQILKSRRAFEEAGEITSTGLKTAAHRMVEEVDDGTRAAAQRVIAAAQRVTAMTQRLGPSQEELAESRQTLRENLQGGGTPQFGVNERSGQLPDSIHVPPGRPEYPTTGAFAGTVRPDLAAASEVIAQRDEASTRNAVTEAMRLMEVSTAKEPFNPWVQGVRGAVPGEGEEAAAVHRSLSALQNATKAIDEMIAEVRKIDVEIERVTMDLHAIETSIAAARPDANLGTRHVAAGDLEREIERLQLQRQHITGGADLTGLLTQEALTGHEVRQESHAAYQQRIQQAATADTGVQTSRLREAAAATLFGLQTSLGSSKVRSEFTSLLPGIRPGAGWQLQATEAGMATETIKPIQAAFNRFVDAFRRLAEYTNAGIERDSEAMVRAEQNVERTLSGVFGAYEKVFDRKLPTVDVARQMLVPGGAPGETREEVIRRYSPMIKAQAVAEDKAAAAQTTKVRTGQTGEKLDVIAEAQLALSGAIEKTAMQFGNLNKRLAEAAGINYKEFSKEYKGEAGTAELLRRLGHEAPRPGAGVEVPGGAGRGASPPAGGAAPPGGRVPPSGVVYSGGFPPNGVDRIVGALNAIHTTMKGGIKVTEVKAGATLKTPVAEGAKKAAKPPEPAAQPVTPAAPPKVEAPAPVIPAAAAQEIDQSVLDAIRGALDRAGTEVAATVHAAANATVPLGTGVAPEIPQRLKSGTMQEDFWRELKSVTAAEEALQLATEAVSKNLMDEAYVLTLFGARLGQGAEEAAVFQTRLRELVAQARGETGVKEAAAQPTLTGAEAGAEAGAKAAADAEEARKAEAIQAVTNAQAETRRKTNEATAARVMRYPMSAEGVAGVENRPDLAQYAERLRAIRTQEDAVAVGAELVAKGYMSESAALTYLLTKLRELHPAAQTPQAEGAFVGQFGTAVSDIKAQSKIGGAATAEESRLLNEARAALSLEERQQAAQHKQANATVEQAAATTRYDKILQLVSDDTLKLVTDLGRYVQQGRSAEEITAKQVELFAGLRKEMGAQNYSKDQTRQAFSTITAQAGAPLGKNALDEVVKTADMIEPALVNEATKQAQAGGGMWSQQSPFMQAMFGNTGFFGRLMATTGTFAVRNFGASFIYGTSAALREAVVEGFEAQSTFVQVSQALDQTGRSSVGLRGQLQQLSQQYGVSLKSVYTTAAGLTGLFDQADKGNAGLVEATKVAVEMEMISRGALNATEAMRSLSSITSSYADVTPSQIADIATVIQNRLSVNLEDTIEGMARLSGQTQEMGLDAQHAMVFVAAISKFTAQSGAAAGEQFSRILESMKTGRVQQQLTEIYGRHGIQLQPLFATRDYQTVLETITKDYGQLAGAERDVAATSLGGARQAASTMAFLSRGSDIIGDLSAAYQSNGRAQERAQQIAKQFESVINRLHQAFVAFFVDLINLHVLDAFGAGLNVLLFLLEKVNDLLSGMIGLIERIPGGDTLMTIGAILAGMVVAVNLGKKAWDGLALSVSRVATQMKRVATSATEASVQSGEAAIGAAGVARAAEGGAALPAAERVVASTPGFGLGRMSRRVRTAPVFGMEQALEMTPAQRATALRNARSAAAWFPATSGPGSAYASALAFQEAARGRVSELGVPLDRGQAFWQRQAQRATSLSESLAARRASLGLGAEALKAADAKAMSLGFSMAAASARTAGAAVGGVGGWMSRLGTSALGTSAAMAGFTGVLAVGVTTLLMAKQRADAFNQAYKAAFEKPKKAGSGADKGEGAADIFGQAAAKNLAQYTQDESPVDRLMRFAKTPFMAMSDKDWWKNPFNVGRQAERQVGESSSEADRRFNDVMQRTTGRLRAAGKNAKALNDAMTANSADIQAEVERIKKSGDSYEQKTTEIATVMSWNTMMNNSNSKRLLVLQGLAAVDDVAADTLTQLGPMLQTLADSSGRLRRSNPEALQVLVTSAHLPEGGTWQKYAQQLAAPGGSDEQRQKILLQAAYARVKVAAAHVRSLEADNKQAEQEYTQAVTDLNSAVNDAGKQYSAWVDALVTGGNNAVSLAERAGDFKTAGDALQHVISELQKAIAEEVASDPKQAAQDEQALIQAQDKQIQERIDQANASLEAEKMHTRNAKRLAEINAEEAGNAARVRQEMMGQFQAQSIAAGKATAVAGAPATEVPVPSAAAPTMQAPPKSVAAPSSAAGAKVPTWAKPSILGTWVERPEPGAMMAPPSALLAGWAQAQAGQASYAAAYPDTSAQTAGADQAAKNKDVIKDQQDAFDKAMALADANQQMLQLEYQLQAAQTQDVHEKMRLTLEAAFQQYHFDISAKSGLGANDPKSIQDQIAKLNQQQAKEQLDRDEAQAARETALAKMPLGDAIGRANATLRNASIARQQAEHYGTTSVQYQQAVREEIAAQQTVDEATRDMVAANTDLAIAVANAHGKTVEAARLGVHKANDALAKAQSRSGGKSTAETQRAMADVQTANAALRDAQVQDAMDTIDFNLQMKNITASSAITQLQEILKRKDLTQQQIRNIQMKIKGLQDEINSAVGSQFNLGAIKVPTVYEVRKGLGIDAIAKVMEEATHLLANPNGNTYRALGGPAAAATTPVYEGFTPAGTGATANTARATASKTSLARSSMSLIDLLRQEVAQVQRTGTANTPQYYSAQTALQAALTQAKSGGSAALGQSITNITVNGTDVRTVISLLQTYLHKPTTTNTTAPRKG